MYWLVHRVTREPHPDPRNLAGFATALLASRWADGWDDERTTWTYSRQLPSDWTLEPKPEIPDAPTA